MEVFKNSFEGGLDTNMSPNLIPNNKYIQASNVNLVANGHFHALVNIKGTTELTTIIDDIGDDPSNVLAVFANNYKIGDEVNIPCLTIITAIDNTFKIWCYDTVANTLYELYEQAITSGLVFIGDNEAYYTDDRVVDGVLYPEAGIDILYFTDNFFKIKKLRCEIPTPYVANFLSELDLQMQRRGALGSIELTSVEDGGSLFAGSYQIAYQLINPDTNQFTKFSLFSNPIHVFLKPSDPFGVGVKSGVGLQSNSKIVFNINLEDEEAAYYTHFRLAVLENIEPSGVNVEIAQLTTIEAVADFINGTVLEDVEYNANIRLESINIAEIVVDLMALDHVKTLTVRQNRLLAGNVTLKALEYDNGEPVISGGEVIKRASDLTKNSFCDPIFASKYRGHFRDEVYRYAISYFDEDMNFSFPKVLDMSSITHNTFGLDLETPPTSGELVGDGDFQGTGLWVDTVYTADDPTSNPSFIYDGNDMVATYPSAPLSSNYMKQTLSLDSTKTYKYELDFANTVMAYVPFLSFWNNTTLISEIPISTSGTFTPPPSTTHIGLRAFAVVGTGTFSYQNFSIKEYEASTPIPPVTVSGYDLKYPSRKDVLSGESFTLFDGDGKLQSLGVQIEGIDNHPSWARGFVILRAKRIKNILFQTPIVPMNKVFGVGALEEYPTLANELSGTGRRTVEYASAQPMGPYTTYVPRNYHWNHPQDIDMYAVSGGASGGGLNKKFTGEAQLVNNATYVLGMVFPPEFMFENKPFLFSPNYKIETVDAMLSRKYLQDFSELTIGSETPGRNIKTSVSGTFHGLEDDRYYYDSAHGGVKVDLAAPVILSDYKEFVNFAEPNSIAGYSVFNYDKLDTPSIFWGTKANTQKCAVVKLDSRKTEVNQNSSLVFGIGSQVAKGAGTNLAFDLTQNNVQTFEIVNVTAGLEDQRYGKRETPHEYIFTGTMVTFSPADLTAIQLGNPAPKTVEVWGGDCYTTPHLFKLTDTCYGLSNSEKFEGLGGLNLINGVRNWEKSFNDLEVASECNMSIPVPYKNAAQYLNVILESEYNAGVLDNEIINIITTYNDDFPVYGINDSSEGAARVPLTYELNQNHKKQNSDKIFRLKDPLVESNNIFKSRLIYSDQKVYQTSINGFDIFRVLNFYDLEETYGQIHSVALAGDDLYTLQQRAVVYIGIGERLLETTEALQLSVQSGSYIGNVMYIDTNRGTQHLKSVLETGTAIYFADNRNKTYNRISGKQLDVLSEPTMASLFRDAFGQKIPEKNLCTSFDPTHKQVWFYSNEFQNGYCYIYDEARNLWISNYTFPDSSLMGTAYIDQTLYGIESRNAAIKLHSMYTGDEGQLFGETAVPFVTFVVNPNLELSKVYDAVSVPASSKMKAFDIAVTKGHDVIYQNLSGVSLDVPTRGEANYRTKVLRASGNARFRGLYATIVMNWHDISDGIDNTSVVLPSVLTKYRLSENKF